MGLRYDFCRSSLSPTLAGHLDRAATISRADYGAALAAADAARRSIDAILTTCDAVLTAAVPGEAPVGLVSTGDSVFNGAWTLAHAPCVTLPAGSGPKGLPVGIQLIGRRGGDAALAALALVRGAARAHRSRPRATVSTFEVLTGSGSWCADWAPDCGRRCRLTA